MLSVVCWKWHTPGFRSTFGAEQVLTLRNMVRRNYPHPHRFICITDDPAGLEEIETVPLWPDFREVQTPYKNKTHPGCFGRLRIFSEEMKAILGPRVVSVDLDVVITGDLTPLWQREDPFVIWGPGPSSKSNGPKQTWNASMFLMNTGIAPQVWSQFKGEPSAALAFRKGFHGSDQGWIEYVLHGSHRATWREKHGVLSFPAMRRAESPHILPEHAKVVFFHGPIDPWTAEAVEMAPWVERYYR